MNEVMLLILMGMLGKVGAQNRRPTISFITQPEIVTDIGGQIEMKCTIQYASDYPVIWMKHSKNDRQNDLPLTRGTTMIIHDPRFHVAFDQGSSTYTLAIKEIQETDSAVYECQVLVSLSDIVKAKVPLIVRRPPIISDNSTRSVVALEGTRVELRCYASGYPPPEIWWRRQNNAVLPTNTSVFKGNILTFPSVTKEHRGTYYCVATNVVGVGARRNVDVEVEHEPFIKIPRKRLGQALQFNMDLECKILAYPPPAIRWFKNGNPEPITNNQHFQISHFAFDDKYVDTILRVITIEKKQYGLYTCEAQNRLGSSSGKVELFETVIPICPPACDSYNYSSLGDFVSSSLFLTLIVSVVSILCTRTFLPR